MSKEHVSVFRTLKKSLQLIKLSAAQLPGKSGDLANQLKHLRQEKETTHQALTAHMHSFTAQVQSAETQHVQDEQLSLESLQNYQDEIKLAVDSTTAGLEGSQDNVRNLGLIMTAGLLGHVEQLSTLDQTDYQADQARLEKLASYQQGWEQVGRELEDILVPLKRADAAARGAIQTDQRLKIEGDARSGIALNQQAIIAYHRGFRLMALAYLEQAARFAPGDIQIGLNLALISLEMNRVDQAEQAWRKATQLSPDSLEVRYVEGMIALQRADTQRAIDVFEACIIAVSNPSDEVAYRSGLAQAYYRHGLARQAILQWEKVLEMEPMHPAAKSWLWAVR